MNEYMLSEILAEMHPNSDSIECVILERVRGVMPQFRRREANLSIDDREMEPHVLAEVVNPNGFASLQQGSLVLLPLNHCRFLPSHGESLEANRNRFFIREKFVRGIVHNNKRWNLDKS
jgi:hypothetical protein